MRVANGTGSGNLVLTPAGGNFMVESNSVVIKRRSRPQAAVPAAREGKLPATTITCTSAPQPTRGSASRWQPSKSVLVPVHDGPRQRRARVATARGRGVVQLRRDLIQPQGSAAGLGHLVPHGDPHRPAVARFLGNAQASHSRSAAVNRNLYSCPAPRISSNSAAASISSLKLV